MKLQVDPNLCTGCYACYVACLDAHFSAGDPEAVSFRRPVVLRDPAEGFQKTICTGCTHCEEAPCLAVCPSGALFRDREGFVCIEPESCTGCGQCAAACPEQVIFLRPGGPARKCDGCAGLRRPGEEPPCVRACFRRAILWEAP